MSARFVDGVGSIPAELLIVGEAPGEDEDRYGVPFVGRSGKLLDSLLKENNLDSVYIDNIVPYRPPNNRRPTAKEVQMWLPRILARVSEVQPRLVVLLGKTAIQAFFPGVGKLKGLIASRRQREIDGIVYTFLFSYHPAFAFRSPKVLKSLRGIFAGIKATASTILLPGYKAVDSEWTPDGKLFTWKKSGDEDGKLVFHNAKADLKKLTWFKGKPFEDTMLVAHALGLPLGLKELYHSVTGKSLRTLDEILTKPTDVVASEKALLPKAERKNVSKKYTMEQKRDEVEEYCQSDADATNIVFSAIYPRMNEKEKALYHNVDIPLVPILMEMEDNGLPIDKGYLRTLQERLERGKEVQLKRLGINNPRSLPQLREKLYTELKIPQIKTTATGQQSTDEETINLLKQQGTLTPEQLYFVNTLLRYRQADKLLTTYVLPWLSSPVDFIYPELDQVGTETFRLSSKHPNGQNIARGPLRGAIAAPPGWVIAEWDASQLEMRVMAVLSGDKNMIEGYQNGIDLHTQASLLIYGDKTKEHRYNAKRANFAVGYGGGIYVLMEKLNISFEKAREFHNKYFKAFPGLRRYFDEQTRLALQTGVVYNYFGRRRAIPALLSNLKWERNKALREALNTPIQSTAVDMIKMIMVDVIPKIMAESQDIRFLIQIHDSVVALMPLKVAREKVEKWTQMFDDSLNKILPILPFKVDLSLYQKWNKPLPSLAGL